MVPTGSGKVAQQPPHNSLPQQLDLFIWQNFSATLCKPGQLYGKSKFGRSGPISWREFRSPEFPPLRLPATPSQALCTAHPPIFLLLQQKKSSHRNPPRTLLSSTPEQGVKDKDPKYPSSIPGFLGFSSHLWQTKRVSAGNPKTADFRRIMLRDPPTSFCSNFGRFLRQTAFQTRQYCSPIKDGDVIQGRFATGYLCDFMSRLS